MNAVLGWAGQFTEAFHGIHFIFPHQELQSLGVLIDDLRLSLLIRAPVLLARAHALYTVFRRIFQMVPKLGIK
jgi:hypothetical protein